MPRIWSNIAGTHGSEVALQNLTDGFVAKRVTDKWITFYNTDRPHTALDKRTPGAAP